MVSKFADAKLSAAVPTPPSSPERRILRFGVFEVDSAAGELRKNGTRIRLQEQPFQILVYLLDRAGEVVTREELRQKLWPADTFVDFDHSLNTAVNKLREALGDSASSPRYVETLARRGYRFLGPVQPTEAQLPPQDSPPMAAEKTALPFHRDLEVPLPRRSVTRSLFALVQFMYRPDRGSRRQPAPHDRRRARDPRSHEGVTPPEQPFQKFSSSLDYLTDFEGVNSYIVGGDSGNFFWHTPKYHGRAVLPHQAPDATGCGARVRSVAGQACSLLAVPVSPGSMPVLP